MKSKSNKKLVHKVDRRKFLGVLGGSAVLGGMLASPKEAFAANIAKNVDDRNDLGRSTRSDAIESCFEEDLPRHKNNGEESDYPFVGNFSKTLVHNSLGEVKKSEYKKLLLILENSNFEELNDLQIGALRLTDPPAGKAFSFTGKDSHQYKVAPCARIDSAYGAAELGVLYWMALCRDVHFSDYDSDMVIAAACTDLNGTFSNVPGPKVGGAITPGTIFRGFTSGDVKGPYISQFLLKDVTFGSYIIPQKQRTVLSATDYMTDFSTWLIRQNGQIIKNDPTYDGTYRYIRNGRDLARWVEEDVLFQAYLFACLIMLESNIPVDHGNPYNRINTVSGFTTFGPPYIQALIAKVANLALKATWFQKWYVHRRLRPEEYGGRVHLTMSGSAQYPVHQDILNSSALDQIFSAHGSYLLPQAFQNGCPSHPSYPAGHATVAGACVTILKAFFDEDVPVENPVVASADGLSLVSYAGDDAGELTIGGELNKLAANIGCGRNFGGVHYFDDYAASLKLGEQVAIDLLKQEAKLFGVKHSYSLTKFDGTKIKIKGDAHVS